MGEPRRETAVCNDVRHEVYNPSLAISTLAHLCREHEQDGFALVRIVPSNPYESVAVFERQFGRQSDG